MTIFRFILSAIMIGCLVGFVSLLWPRLTDVPRPDILTEIHDTVMKTQTGSQIALVLGVSEDRNIEKLTPEGILSTAQTFVFSAASERIRDVVMTHAFRQLLTHYESLSTNEKLLLQQYVCSSSSASKNE